MLTLLFFLLICVYNIPSIIALTRHHPDAFRILIVNILLGWTAAGYVVALVWACWPIPEGRRIKYPPDWD